MIASILCLLSYLQSSHQVGIASALNSGQELRVNVTNNAQPIGIHAHAGTDIVMKGFCLFV
jgi:hypothetical protein